jgi:hypothetical protein
MRSPVLLTSLTALAFAGILGLSTPSMAAMVAMKADMRSATEVPANASTGTGTLTATYDETSKKLTWKGKTSGLTGPATAAHFHGPAEAGKNADVVIPITGSEKDSFEGSATLTEAQAADMLAGKWYVNVHTATNKGGEIRGQLMK